ncbi:hypothetical protein HKBW3S06_00403 [Candidatus Hakubella thermalkaliphila]|uniref:Helicase C-terminal domain-containing protein n=3 Tax=Candidatus Hakubella thermalkaliphila TaxID=2754717 RepID=A0A6V8QAK4_9ACTN|nr:helicase-related protein [Candidatus Hakubella thermalkaliphila]GFP21177.1 hypothetical protein HKBW3S06_00403 [Candidatus Hakubella thermalkaliphila]GFP41715.1 hypothetical protein HKBW3C_00841 [Candidatus Hakubella thermalkaliphila]
MAEDIISNLNKLQNKKVNLPGHFSEPVFIEDVRFLGSACELRVRCSDGHLEEVVLDEQEVEELQRTAATEEAPYPVAKAALLRLLLESSRIRLAYAYDPYFAVSLSGIRTLPHQIEAVYGKMIPQPRLRFLLADDPGAGKTIMAGLYIKEMKLRQAIERVLIVVPAALTIQWQDELLRFFNEYFEIVGAERDRQQLINPWQRENQIITSLDYAKQENVRERVWSQPWDLLIIDEAHKCSAYTKRRSGRSPEAEKTKRYQLAEKLTNRTDNALLLTATPHHGDDDRFAHFLRLIDSDLFPEPHRLEEKAREIRRNIFELGPDCPWAIRRLKEDLRDLDGKRLFPDRHTQTVTFHLNTEEYALYKAVNAYLNEFLSQGTGRQKQSIALTRTVLQRRLASSTRAIYESLRRRFEKQRALLGELESLSPAERRRRLEQLRGRLTDEEREEDDLDERERDSLVEEFTTAEELERLQMEVIALKDLVAQARRVYEHAPDSKLAALKDCLKKAQFNELRDGRGKLLIFSEHRDTVAHLREQLERWNFSTCDIHGGMDVHQRKRQQEIFRTQVQICVATEAAGEGINLQFCHLMINYDLPWNPTRLEQRLGRIHRIGQTRDVYAFNFVADESEEGQPVIEGRILRRLLEKLEQMRAALGSDRVYDVIGEILSLNEVNLADMLRQATYDPRRLDEYLDQIERIDPERLRQYEEMTGIALARSHVSFDAFQKTNFEAEEHRLMPEYVKEQFLVASQKIGLRVEPRADGLWRVPHVPQDLRSERWQAIRYFGRPESDYRKITFYKEHLEQDQHLDAVLVGPGHTLYAVVDEALNERLANLRGSIGVFIDPNSQELYWLHFFETEVVGDAGAVLYAELSAVQEKRGNFELVPADIFHDLVPWEEGESKPPPSVSSQGQLQAATDFLRMRRQLTKRQEVQKDRQHYQRMIYDYLKKSFDERIYAQERRVMQFRFREDQGEKEVALARQEAERYLEDLRRQKVDRLRSVEQLTVVRTGPVRHLASLCVLPPTVIPELLPEDEEVKTRSELAAMTFVMEYERERGWEPQDVSALKIGFDIRSLGPPDPITGRRDVRRIEVKGRQGGQPIRLTTNEWFKAKQLRDTYWLYVVWNPTESDAEAVFVADPAHTLQHIVREVRSLSHYEITAEAILEFGLRENIC